jgi:hypothetical protein
MAIQVAESKQKASKVQRTLAHLEIHPVLGAGHMVRHVYAGFGHEPKEVKFNAQGKSQGGEHITQHLAKHAGLPEYSKGEESGTERERQIDVIKGED